MHRASYYERMLTIISSLRSLPPIQKDLHVASQGHSLQGHYRVLGRKRSRLHNILFPPRLHLLATTSLLGRPGRGFMHEYETSQPRKRNHELSFQYRSVHCSNLGHMATPNEHATKAARVRGVWCRCLGHCRGLSGPNRPISHGSIYEKRTAAYNWDFGHVHGGIVHHLHRRMLSLRSTRFAILQTARHFKDNNRARNGRKVDSNITKCYQHECFQGKTVTERISHVRRSS